MGISSKSIKGFFEKDENSFNAVYEATYRLLKHIALEILHDDDEANGIVTDAYLKALISSSSYHESGKFLPWLCSITKNLALTKLQNLRKTPLSDEENPEIGVLDPVIDETYLLLKKTLNQEEFDIVIFHIYHDLSFKEISAIIGGGDSSVRGKYHRAIVKLRESNIF